MFSSALSLLWKLPEPWHWWVSRYIGIVIVEHKDRESKKVLKYSIGLASNHYAKGS